MSDSNRIRDAVLGARSEGRACLASYWPAGYPSPREDDRFLAEAARADILEVGIPFSDPAADGPVLQAASAQAIAAGATVEQALRRIRDLRRTRPDLPIAVMTYANLVHRNGWESFAARAAEAGVDGLILPDVPVDESGPVRHALRDAGLAWIPVVSPRSDATRIRAAAQDATGFLYLAANIGLTGQAGLADSAVATVRRVRSVIPAAPLLVGFGVRTRQDVQRLRAAGADGAIVGSALVEEAPRGAAAVGALVQQLRGAP
ncbi:MAG: tryptophan synthase subunit alpha [Candidatus Thermoplasmatota archaeon]